MCGINADIHEIVGIENVKLNVLGEGVFLAVLLKNDGNGDLHDLGLIGSVLEAKGLVLACAYGAGIGLSADDLTAVCGVGNGLDDRFGRLTVEYRGRKLEFLAGNGSGGSAFDGGDAELEAFAHPHGSGHGKVAVALGDADVIVAVVRIEGHGEVALCKLCGVGPGVDGLAGVYDDLDLGDGVTAVRVGYLNADIKLIGDLSDAAAELHAVHGVVQLKILVLGGVHAHRSDSVIDALFGEVVGEDDVACVVCVAPFALVVILIVGGSDVPALIQRHCVVLIAGIIAACAYLAFAVTDLNEEDAAVDDRVPIAEISEGSEGGAGVIELTDGISAFRLAKKTVIGFHAGVVSFVVEGRVVSGYDAGGVEGIDMTGAAGPCHLKARHSDKASRILFIERSNLALIIGPFFLALSGRLAHIVESVFRVCITGGVKVVGVVGEGHKVNICALGKALYILKSLLQSAGAVGILAGVGMKLTVVKLVLSLTDGKAP